MAIGMALGAVFDSRVIK